MITIRFLRRFALLCVALNLASSFPLHGQDKPAETAAASGPAPASSLAPATPRNSPAPPPTDAGGKGSSAPTRSKDSAAPGESKASPPPADSGPTPWSVFGDHSGQTWCIAVAAAVFILLMYLVSRSSGTPRIPTLGPPFFFWLGMGYMILLLVIAVAYTAWHHDAGTTLIAGILPIAVPWFGALGAVTISLEGVFMWNDRWNNSYNYWHLGRPLFGAVLGTIAFFLYVVLVTASGTPPKFLEAPNVAPKDLIIFYALAFLVGYREETFREMIKRFTDLILKPGTPTTPTPLLPTVVFKEGGVAITTITFSPIAPMANATKTIEIRNTGAAALKTPTVVVSIAGNAAAGTFTKAQDLVTTGVDLGPGESRKVDVVFAPTAAGDWTGTVSFTAANLTTPTTIPITGVAQ